MRAHFVSSAGGSFQTKRIARSLPLNTSVSVRAGLIGKPEDYPFLTANRCRVDVYGLNGWATSTMSHHRPAASRLQSRR